jgi:hypothetical protein
MHHHNIFSLCFTVISVCIIMSLDRKKYRQMGRDIQPQTTPTPFHFLQHNVGDREAKVKQEVIALYSC